MKQISIVVLHEATMTSIDGALQILSRVNDFLAYQKKPPFYKIEMVGVTKNVKINGGSFTVQCDRLIKDIRKTDLVIIPAVCGDFPKIIKANKPYGDWIMDQYEKGAELVTLCVGSYVLASTGLLDGKKCAIHWATANEFKGMFPNVKLINDKIITDEDGIYTGAGSYSFLNLLLYIIEKHLGRELAILASRMFQIDIDRKDQKPFVIFMAQKQHGDESIGTAQEIIENNYSQKFNIENLSRECGVGRRTFERRFKKSTGNSVMEYIQRVRVEAAKRQLETGKKTIKEVIYDVGYGDINAFRTVFKKYTGLSPLNYRNKYRLLY